MRLEGIKVGDRITIRSSRDMPSIRTVTKVTKTSITDDKGGRWSYPYGSEWGREYGDRCEKWKPEHDAMIAECQKEFQAKRRRNFVHYYSFSGKPQELIDAVYEVLQRFEEKKG